MNKAILVGRLTKDPDVRYSQAGKCVTSFTLAVDRYRSKGEEKTADFIPCVAFDKLAETCGNYLVKGSKILVEGRIQIRSYDDKNGQKRWVTEVVMTDMEFLEKKSAAKGQESSGNDYVNSFGKDVPLDEEIPF